MKIQDVEVAMAERPRGEDLIFAGDFKDITASIATAGKEDIVRHFLLKGRVWGKDWKTWVW